MNKVYKILMMVIGLKAVMGITYIHSIISGMILYLEVLENGFGFNSIVRLLDWFLILTVSIILIIGLVLQLLRKTMRLNIWLKLAILYYTAYFITVGLPSLIFMDFNDYIARMNSLEKLRFFTNDFAIVALIIIYAVFSIHFFKRKNHKIGEDVSAKRAIRFLNYMIDFLMIAYLSFWSSKHEYFQHWEYPLIFVLIALVYYFSLEVLFRQTLGKVVTNTYVSNTTYAFVWSIFLRTLCRRIPFEPLSFFGSGRWHDRLSKTEIVKIEPTHPV